MRRRNGRRVQCSGQAAEPPTHSEREDIPMYLVAGIEQMWEKITPGEREGGLPASSGAERGAAAQQVSTVPGTHVFVV